MKERDKEPIFTIGITAGMLKVCPATLRIWERKDLIKPSRIGKNRFYSRCDLNKLEYIKKLIQKKRINIEGVRNILKREHCWDIKQCKSDIRKACPVYLAGNSTR